MDWLPGADNSRVLPGFTTTIRRHRGIVFHVAVSEAAFPSYGAGLGAHWYIRKWPGWRLGVHAWDASHIAQQISAAIKGGHAYQGNADLLGVETQGGVNDPQNEPWDEYQLESIARLALFAHTEKGVAIRQMATSDDYGVGWHRHGCDGNFPPLPSILAGRLQRGGVQKWSTSAGKVCPGNVKITQMPSAIARAAALAGGAPTPPPTPEDDMFEEADRALLTQTLAAANAANAAAAAARAEAERATNTAREAITVGRQAVLLSSLGRSDSSLETGTLLRRLDDLQDRLPRVNTARYDRPGASTYAELAAIAQAQGLTYANVSGQLAGVQVDVDNQLVADAAKAGAIAGVEAAAPTGGTFTLGSS